MSYFRITDGKGFAMQFANGWAISVQFGWGNYCGNKENSDGGFDEPYDVRSRRLGASGCSDAEVAVFNPQHDMVKLPAFMFPDDDYTDIVSGWNGTNKVLELMKWVAEQPKGQS